MAHAFDRCAQCGQVDDHPKWQVTAFAPGGGLEPVQTLHHDCAPAGLREQHAGHPHLPKIIEAAERGLRGEALRAYIRKLHGEG